MINKQVTWIGLPRVMVAIVSLVALLALAPGKAHSADCSTPPCVATDGGDSIEVNPTTNEGMKTWSDDGTSDLSQQWFWFRINEDSEESSLDEAPMTLDSADATDDVITLNYSGRGLAVTVVYDLDDLGIGRSRIRETVSIKNTSVDSFSIDLHWFEYTNLDIGGSVNDTASINAAGNTINQVDTTRVTVLALPTPDHFEIGAFSGIRDSLDNMTVTTLTDATSPFGPADVEHTYQWDVTLPPGAVFNITKIKESNPEDLLTTLGHFLCYKVRAQPKFEKRTVSLDDQFENKSFKVKKPKLLCIPAEKDGEPIFDPFTHLKSYKTNRGGSKHDKQTVQVTNQFGTITVKTKKPVTLLVPTIKDLDNPVVLPNPFIPGLDHYKCYKVKNLSEFNKQTVTVSDQLINTTLLVKKPTKLCTPVAKNGDTFNNIDNVTHLMCYKVKKVKKKVENIHVNNQFGPEILKTKKIVELCVPSTKTE